MVAFGEVRAERGNAPFRALAYEAENAYEGDALMPDMNWPVFWAVLFAFMVQSICKFFYEAFWRWVEYKAGK